MKLIVLLGVVFLIGCSGAQVSNQLQAKNHNDCRQEMTSCCRGAETNKSCRHEEVACALGSEEKFFGCDIETCMPKWDCIAAADQPKLRICPDQWIQNRMPRVGDEDTGRDEGPRDYFILNNTRMELSEFDMDWVMNNCNIEPQVVV